MNLQTGKKEAKLIDLNSNEEDKGTSLTYDKDKQETIVDDKVAESIKKIDDETRQVSYYMIVMYVALYDW
jgi:hypothetical protein